MTERYALEACALTKRFGNTVALDNLELNVTAGEVVCLLGANGAGKSTTINLFLGFLHPDSGYASVNGINVANDPLQARRQLAYLPESVALYPNLTGFENLSFFDRLADGNHTISELEQILIESGLPKNAMHRRTSDYSKGMRQKVGIAIAMARSVDTLLLDEPLSGLDPSAANSLVQSISRLRDNGKAVLMATHDIFRAKAIGNRIGIMMQGKLVNMLDAAALNAGEIESVYLEHMSEAENESAETVV